MFKRPITWAELILIITLGPIGLWGIHNAYEYLTDKIIIQIEIKK